MQILSDVCIDDSSEPYSIGLAACGYEKRASNAIKKITAEGIKIKTLIGILFPANHVLDYQNNFNFFNELGARFIESGELRQRLGDILSEISGDVRVIFDISSCTREVIATVLLVFSDWATSKCVGVDVDFAYSLAKYTPPPLKFGPIKFNGPVLPEFSGMFYDCALPCAAILGLGYELDIALGTLESIEPERIIAFYPSGTDPRFEKQVLSANQYIVEGGLATTKIPYHVPSPLQIYDLIMSVCGDLIHDYRPILIPFGPKIFATISILASLAYSRKIPVWRVSPVDLEEPSSIEAAGPIIFFRCKWSAE